MIPFLSIFVSTNKCILKILSFPNLLEWLTWCDYYFLNNIRKLDLIHWVAPMELHINSNWLLPMIKYISPSRSILCQTLLTLTSSIYENILYYIFSRMHFACILLRGGQWPKHTYTFLFEKSYILWKYFHNESRMSTWCYQSI